MGVQVPSPAPYEINKYLMLVFLLLTITLFMSIIKDTVLITVSNNYNSLPTRVDIIWSSVLVILYAFDWSLRSLIKVNNSS